VSRHVYVIPNALVPEQFTPHPEKQPSDTSKSSPLVSFLITEENLVTIVVLSRLAYRKGIDLLIATAPRVCALFPNVKFVVGAFWVVSVRVSLKDK
jgi:phosphatidylinositol glycan class A protein